MARLLITPGEPAGIGPDLLVKLVQQPPPCPLTAIADPELLSARAALLGLPLTVNEVSLNSLPEECAVKSAVNVLPVPLQAPTHPGELDVRNAAYVIETLRVAASLCLDTRANGVVTGPVNKAVINDAGLPFSGHTEYFAEHSGVNKVVMMLATEGLRVALATTHLPLKDVPQAITQSGLRQTLQILIEGLRQQMGITQPHILVAGLNPHAGESGHLGREELDVIQPVIASFTDSSTKITGPLPADTLFRPDLLARADAVLAMYHDQGLPVLKYKGFGKAVNITLGLPFVRTSVDHGTALNLAGSGRADESSLRYAIETAYQMVKTHS